MPKKYKKEKKEKRSPGKALPLKSKILKIFRCAPTTSFSYENVCSILKADSANIQVLIAEFLAHLTTENVLRMHEGDHVFASDSTDPISKFVPKSKETSPEATSEPKEKQPEKAVEPKPVELKETLKLKVEVSKPKAETPKFKASESKETPEPKEVQSKVPNKKGTIGRISFTQRGVAYVTIDGVENDIYVHQGNSGRSLNGDIVEIKINQFKGKSEGEVIGVVERARTTYVGTIDQFEKEMYVIPDDKNIPVDFHVSRENTKGAKVGEKVLIQFLSWPDESSYPIGKVTDVLGLPGSKNVDMHSILAENGLPYKFPPEVLKESELIASGDYGSIEGRRDMRDTLTFTIDPIDAKDFDDALSFKRLDHGNIEVGVHIADVSNFVKPGSALDKEAYERGNSVYLVDRVVPMLPEVLSNELCSLRPNEDKLTFSAIFKLDHEGKIISEWFGKTVIHSDQRFAYEQAQEIIEGKADETFGEPILTLDNVAKTLRKKRLECGALNIESEEVRFELNAEGEPIGLLLKVSKCANKLIEEFMLLANRRVALFIGGFQDDQYESPCVFRVHGEPNPEKIADLEIFLKQFGYIIERREKRPLASALNDILEKAKDKEELHIIGPMVIRSMSSALYDTNNIGHYGLAFEHYTHFTSPIRRYADLLVHRILLARLEKKTYKGASELNAQCQHISETEKRAAKAERASTKFMQVKYMADKIGKVYTGMITGVTEWGVFVEMMETNCEGLVHISTLEGHFSVNVKTKKLEDVKSGTAYHLGQKVNVSVKSVNEAKKQIDLLLVI